MMCGMNIDQTSYCNVLPLYIYIYVCCHISTVTNAAGVPLRSFQSSGLIHPLMGGWIWMYVSIKNQLSHAFYFNFAFFAFYRQVCQRSGRLLLGRGSQTGFDVLSTVRLPERTMGGLWKGCTFSTAESPAHLSNIFISACMIFVGGLMWADICIFMPCICVFVIQCKTKKKLINNAAVCEIVF